MVMLNKAMTVTDAGKISGTYDIGNISQIRESLELYSVTDIVQQCHSNFLCRFCSKRYSCSLHAVVCWCGTNVFSHLVTCLLVAWMPVC